MTSLADWQLARLESVHLRRVEYGRGRADVTVLAYHFWGDAGNDAAFARVECAVRETWLRCGMMKTVLVVNRETPRIAAFASAFPAVEVQVEPSLVPGRIYTMSADCNGRLAARFDTPYVLVVQNDGFPLRPGLDAFVGPWDFVGAPYVRNVWWKNAVAGALNLHVMNGGFSLRSHEICERAAFHWKRGYCALPDCNAVSEDLFYTKTLILRERAYRRSARLPTHCDALAFSWDALDTAPIPRPAALPFGFHGEGAFRELADEAFGHGA